MANTERTQAQLLTIFKNNKPNGISAQDIRDLVVSSHVDEIQENLLDLSGPIQEQLDAKQATITGGASTIVSSDLTASRALVSNGSGKIAVSSVTSTQLGYLDATSSIQTQLNSKAASSSLGTAAALNVGTGNNEIVQLTSSGKLPAVSGENLTNLPSSTPGTDTLTSASTVNLDFSSINNAKLNIGHNVTFTTSNRAANKLKTLTIFGHASNTYSLAYPSDWKNCGGVTLPTSIAANAVYQFRFMVFGTAETDVCVEFVSGAGTNLTLSVPANLSFYKGGNSNVGITGGLGGPVYGWVLLTVSVTKGTFTVSANYVSSISSIDMGTGRYTSGSFFSVVGSNTQSSVSSITWYGDGTPGTGSMSVSLSDAHTNPSGGCTLTEYGENEVQKLEWKETGYSNPYTPTGGTYTITVPGYGPTVSVNAAGGTSALQSALSTLMGSDAPTVSGGGDTWYLTFSNGSLAHTDVGEVSFTNGTPEVNNGNNYGWANYTKTLSGDGVSISDTYTGDWDYYGVGLVNFGGTDVTKTRGASTTSFSVSGVTYNLTDAGTSFTIAASDFVDHGTLSATPNYGTSVSAYPSTTTVGNS